LWDYYPIALTEPGYPTVAMYQTRDRRWFMMNGGYPLLRDGLLDLLTMPKRSPQRWRDGTPRIWKMRSQRGGFVG
jgi:hypothetical protein